MDDYDPRARRLNPLIDELVGTLDENWRFMLSADDYLERKGRLRMVRQVIDQILEQPEWLEADLQPGAVDDSACWFDPEEFAGEPAPVFLDEKPFDLPGPGSGRNFFYTDTGRASPLYEGAPMDPRLRPLTSNGLWLYTLEKHYVTAVDTTNHAINANLWEQLAPQHDGRGEREAPRYFLISDPRGIGGGRRAEHIASFVDPGRAVEVADSLSERIGIRIVVACERRRWCTR